MTKTKFNLEYFVLKTQANNNIKEIWSLFLEIFDKNKIKDDSYLIIKSPFKHKLYYIKNKIVKTKNLKEENFKFKESDFDEKGYSFDKNKKIFSGYWSLSFSQIECSICVDNYNDAELFEQDENHNLIITFLRNHINLILHIDHLNMHSIKDDLTLLYNQNYLKSFIDREINRSKRYNLQFSVIFFDLDYLKDINEKHGHLIGTEVLKEVSRILKKSIRSIDVVARFGGDEFVVVLSDSNPDLTLRISQRLRKAIKGNLFLKKEGLNLKVSGCFGISNFPDHGDSVDGLIKKADMAMYKVKRSGKDGIQVYKGD